MKVNSIRIELGEIEAALLKHPQINAAAVVAKDYPSSGVITVPRVLLIVHFVYFCCR